jgi:hypothetical protein
LLIGIKIASANMNMASPTGDQEKMHVGVGCGKSSGLLCGSPGFLRSYCAAFADPRACCVGLPDFSGPSLPRENADAQAALTDCMG